MQNNWKSISLVCFSFISLVTSIIGQNITPVVNSDLSPQEWFTKGNDAYDAGNYSLAIDYFLAIDSSNLYSAEVYQNLGNAYYKSNHTPGAVYYFEKALKLQPGNADIIHNLEIANKRVVDQNTKKSSPGVFGWVSSSIGKSSDYWSRLTLLVLFVSVIFISLPILMKKIKLKSLFNIFGISGIILGLVFLCFAFIQNNEMNSHNYGINFSASVEIKNEPSGSSSTAFVLHEGTKMEILDASKKWYKIQFNDQVGWIPKECLKSI